MRPINRTVFGISKGNSIDEEVTNNNLNSSRNVPVANRRVAQMPARTKQTKSQIIDRSNSQSVSLCKKRSVPVKKPEIKPVIQPEKPIKEKRKKKKRCKEKEMDEIIIDTFNIEKEPLKYKPESFGELVPIKYSYKTPRGRKYKELGFEVKDVARLYPELVTYGDNGTPIKVQYDCFIPLLVREVQALRERLQYLEQEF